MRCFIAVDIDEGVRARIAHYQKEFQKNGSFHKREVKWIEAGNIHLTLKFLGEVPDDRIMDICGAVKEAAGGCGSFYIDVRGLGCFGRPARVVWAGINESKELLELQSVIDERTAELGWPGEARKFSGHLTLCRVKSPKAGRQLQRNVEDYADVDLGSVFVDSVCVYKSDLTSDGPVYTVVSKSVLGSGKNFEEM